MTCDHTCKICGRHEKGNWDASLTKRLEETQLCFYCDFWQPKITAAANGNPRVVRVNGVHYWIADPKSGPSHCKGFGGAPFKIRFFDGREVTTDNLWCQGDIPEHFKDQLPDNAEFIK